MAIDMESIQVIGQDQNRNLLDRLAANAIKNKLHVMLLGPSGHGKTNLAYYFGKQLDSEMTECLGSDIDKLIAHLEKEPEGVIFIDEIHLIPPEDQERLYKHLDNGYNLFIAATTDLDLLKEPLRNRFAVVMEIEHYSLMELIDIARKETEDDEIAWLAVHLGQLVPRKILASAKIMRSLELEGKPIEDKIESAMMMSTNILGIDRRSRAYLDALSHGKPMGVNRISGIVNEKKSTLEIDVEPYLLRQGFIISTPRGRQITDWGISVLELSNNMSKEIAFGLIDKATENMDKWIVKPYSLGQVFAL